MQFNLSQNKVKQIVLWDISIFMNCCWSMIVLAILDFYCFHLIDYIEKFEFYGQKRKICDKFDNVCVCLCVASVLNWFNRCIWVEWLQQNWLTQASHMFCIRNQRKEKSHICCMKKHIIASSLSLFIELNTIWTDKDSQQLETVDRKRNSLLFPVQIDRVQYIAHST